jgi:hypothetical protein
MFRRRQIGIVRIGQRLLRGACGQQPESVLELHSIELQIEVRAPFRWRCSGRNQIR